MSKPIISQSREEDQILAPNEVLKRLSRFYKIPADKVIQHLYSKFNYTYTDVAKILGTSRQDIEQKYPKNKEVKA